MVILINQIYLMVKYDKDNMSLVQNNDLVQLKISFAQPMTSVQTTSTVEGAERNHERLTKSVLLEFWAK